MPHKSEFYAKAAAVVQRRKNSNMAELARRREEIHAAVPAVFESIVSVDARVAKQFSKIAECVRSRMPPDKVRERMAEIEVQTKNLRRERGILLKKAGKPSDYLDVFYTCKLCGDSGIASDGYCDCFMREVRKAAAAEISGASGMKLTSFKDFDLAKIDTSGRDIMSSVLDRCVEFARDFAVDSKGSSTGGVSAGLYMYGHAGVGKTHLSLAIAGAVIDKGYSVAYGSAPDLYRKVEKEHFGKKDFGREQGDDTEVRDSTLDTLLSVDLLILDDVGAEFRSPFYDSVLYNILNTRGNRRLPLIISSNLFPSDVEERYDERIFSRVSALELLPFFGDDMRRCV
ncbi:DNA replication protein DnaC [Clostridia bacterium]|nr:DNA replication protein DnaC [Clostridia bacterium]